MGVFTPQEVIEGIYLIKGGRPSSHVYLVRSRTKNVLNDSGTREGFDDLAASLSELGLAPSDIDVVINTHEHFDHIGANVHFANSAVIAAHRLAATKLERSDEYVTMHTRTGDDSRSTVPTPHLWLEDKNLFDLGDFHLQVAHTPGHTSGSICLYEPIRRLLFSGDTVFARGTLPAIAPSGSAGDYMSSLSQLVTKKIALLLPGHGKISDQPEADIFAALDFARDGLSEAAVLGGEDTWSESTPLEAFV